MQIQYVKESDAEELLAIYAPYITDTAITFEYEIPSVEEFRERIQTISARYPYLKAVDENGVIAGYAYATAFKNRAAYDWSVETTIYLKEGCKRLGIGTKLYDALEQDLKEMGILNMNACIAYPKKEGPYLTMDSVHFHKKMGFAKVGIFHDSGYKFDQWFDMIWMEKMIGEHTAPVKMVQFGGNKK